MEVEPGGKTILQRWFPGYAGWYGTQPDTQQLGTGTSTGNVGEPPPKISKTELGTL